MDTLPPPFLPMGVQRSDAPKCGQLDRSMSEEMCVHGVESRVKPHGGVYWPEPDCCATQSQPTHDAFVSSHNFLNVIFFVLECLLNIQKECFNYYIFFRT